MVGQWSGTRYVLCRFPSRRIYLVPHDAGYLSSGTHDGTGPVKQSGRLLDSVFPGKVLVRTLRVFLVRRRLHADRLSLFVSEFPFTRLPFGETRVPRKTSITPLHRRRATGEIELAQSRVYFGGNVRVMVQYLFFLDARIAQLCKLRVLSGQKRMGHFVRGTLRRVHACYAHGLRGFELLFSTLRVRRDTVILTTILGSSTDGLSTVITSSAV